MAHSLDYSSSLDRQHSRSEHPGRHLTEDAPLHNITIPQYGTLQLRKCQQETTRNSVGRGTDPNPWRGGGA